MATYYIDATGGLDTNDGLAQTDQGGGVGPWQTIAKVNGSSFSGDDQVLFKRGELWRETLTVPSAGTSGHQIVFSAYGTGALPKIYGSTAVTSWTNESGNLWYASVASDPATLWVVGLSGESFWGTKESLKGNLSAEYEWWWDSGNTRVYLYAATDPDSRYSSVERTTRSFCIDLNGQSYVTVSYFELAFAGLVGSELYAACIWQSPGPNPGTYGVLVEYNECHHAGFLSAAPQGNCMLIYVINNSVVRYNICYAGGRRGICLFAGNPGRTCSDNIVEHNSIRDCYHSGIDYFCGGEASTEVDNAQIRYNLIYTTAKYGEGYTAELPMHGILLQSDHATIKVTNSKIYGNVVLNLHVNAGITMRANNGTQILNNTVYGYRGSGTYTSGIAILSDTTASSNIVIKNNIVSTPGNGNYGLSTPSAYISECDYNCWYNPGYGYVLVGATPYNSGDFAAYKSATGWDTNGLWEDPKLLNPTESDTGDVHLASDSPCRDAGIDVSIAVDYDGVAIPQNGTPDMGAFEYETLVASHISAYRMF